MCTYGTAVAVPTPLLTIYIYIYENDETQIQFLKLVLKATNEKYESMLKDAKHEIDVLMNTKG